MISLSNVVGIVVFLIIAALVFALLFFLVNYIGGMLGEGGQLFIKAAKIVLVVAAVLVLIGLLLSFVSGQPLFRP